MTFDYLGPLLDEDRTTSLCEICKLMTFDKLGPLLQEARTTDLCNI